METEKGEWSMESEKSVGPWKQESGEVQEDRWLKVGSVSQGNTV